ncbi:PREDICTED: uncharacterized protein LOC109158785 [Ipomoea nil]|uniref:uncharacterized protein LOC109158785 n=1 Tax=Ipomoea nil TaxID=35883 RepID=UPI000900D623|nr:PREDICTED: uncharacterized protein LOC109158785 [Ipomoea nil]
MATMDTRGIEEACAVMKLTEEEIGGLEAPEEQVIPPEIVHHELVGRFLTDRPIKHEHMQQVLASVWRPVMGMRILPIEENLFLFQFPHLKDMQRVIDDGPWTFENHTLALDKVPIGANPADITLEFVDFWIQVHDLPIVFASADFIPRIGNHIGTFKATDPHNFGGTWRSFFRIRVQVDIRQPLKRRMRLFRRDGSAHWVNFKYERLGTFGFCCGVLGHSEKFCKKAYDEGLEPDIYPYGAWMRVGARRQVRPIGAKWLLQDLPSAASPAPTQNSGSTIQEVEAVEPSTGLHGDLKRRREGNAEEDVIMVDHSKNAGSAILAAQARPLQ